MASDEELEARIGLEGGEGVLTNALEEVSHAAGNSGAEVTLQQGRMVRGRVAAHLERDVRSGEVGERVKGHVKDADDNGSQVLADCDVMRRGGGRVYTTADADRGRWALAIPVPLVMIPRSVTRVNATIGALNGKP